MLRIYSYQKVTDKYTTHTVAEPDYREGDERITELCTLVGITYISVPDSVTLPEQSKQVQKTLKIATLTKELKGKIKETSVHYKLIKERVENMLPAVKPEDGRYFMLSFDSTKMEAKKAEHHIVEVLNLKEALSPHMKESAGYLSAIEQWGTAQKMKLGI